VNFAAAEYLSGKARELENNAIMPSPSGHGSVRLIDRSRACAGRREPLVVAGFCFNL
jgi:hypothetical protein